MSPSDRLKIGHDGENSVHNLSNYFQNDEEMSKVLSMKLKDVLFMVVKFQPSSAVLKKDFAIIANRVVCSLIILENLEMLSEEN